VETWDSSMSNSQNNNSEPVPRGQARREAREERSGKALRDNLRRRKDQARGRAESEQQREQADSHDSGD